MGERVRANRADAGPVRADWVGAYAITVPDDARTAEDWARELLEGLPSAIRWVLVAGWRYGLGLRLDPGDGTGRILGWPITEREPGRCTVSAPSRLLVATNSVARAGTTLTWTTTVDYRSRFGRLMWTVAALVHRRTAPLFLGLAANRRRPLTAR